MLALQVPEKSRALSTPGMLALQVPEGSRAHLTPDMLAMQQPLLLKYYIQAARMLGSETATLRPRSTAGRRHARWAASEGRPCKI